MGKLNEIQEQTTQSYGSNSFTTRIKENTVEFDSAKDKFTFLDPVEVPSINIGGTSSVVFTQEEKTKLSQITTPMQIQGRVDSVSDLPTENVAVGDTYLVGLSGSETFDEYVCVGLSGSPEAPVWESVGSTQVQADWNQNDNTKADYIKNRICYEETNEYVLLSGNFGASGGQFTSNNWYDECYSYDWSNLYFDINGEHYTLTKNSNYSAFTMDELVVISGGFSTSNFNISFSIDTRNNPKITLGIAGADIYVNSDFKLYFGNSTTHPIDDKYISETIARTDDLKISSGSGNNSIVAKNFTNCYANGNYAISLATNKYALDDNSTSFGNASTVQYGTLSLTYVSSNTFTTNYDYSKYKGCKCKKVVNGDVEDTIITISNAVYDENASKTTFTISGLGSSNTEIYVLRGAIGAASFSEGWDTISSGMYAHSEGDETVSSGSASHSEGSQTVASGNRAHSEGEETIASGGAAHSEGYMTTASGDYSHSEGEGTIAAAGSSSVCGSYNIADPIDITQFPDWQKNTAYTVGDKVTNNGYYYICKYNHTSGNYFSSQYWNYTVKSNYVEIVGNGTSDNARSNARTLDWSGNEVLSGTLTAIAGVSTKKLTISSIDPTDVFMHSEIIDASSDVSFSRVVANASSSKTDGYVEILYKASSGVTCSAYIDSADVTLTADGAWHKLEQGCDPADGVEIHINNPSPVTDATLEVISKVYYI